MYSVSIRNIENSRRAEDEAADVRAEDGADAEQAEPHQRLRLPQLPDDEADEQRAPRRRRHRVWSAESQPQSVACVIPKTSALSPPVTRTAPTAS